MKKSGIDAIPPKRPSKESRSNSNSNDDPMDDQELIGTQNIEKEIEKVVQKEHERCDGKNRKRKRECDNADKDEIKKPKPNPKKKSAQALLKARMVQFYKDSMGINGKIKFTSIDYCNLELLYRMLYKNSSFSSTYNKDPNLEATFQKVARQYFNANFKSELYQNNYLVSYVTDENDHFILNDDGQKIPEYQKDKEGKVKRDAEGNPIVRKKRESKKKDGVEIPPLIDSDPLQSFAIQWLYLNCYDTVNGKWSITDRSLLLFNPLQELLKHKIIEQCGSYSINTSQFTNLLYMDEVDTFGKKFPNVKMVVTKNSQV